VVDSKTGPLGTVDAVDDSTPNILFQVRDGGRERIIPANPEWITRVDRKNRTLMYNLPEGLTEL
jgi:16S rRNA processing protein RimM